MQIRRFAIDRFRQEHRRQQREQAYADINQSWFVEAEKGSGLEGVERILMGLPPEQQEVLVLKIWGDQTFESIGRALDISPNTAASRYRYGLEHLRRELNVEESK